MVWLQIHRWISTTIAVFSLKCLWALSLTCGRVFGCDFMVTGHFYPTMSRYTVQTQGLLTLDTPSTNLTLFTPGTLKRLIQHFELRFTMKDKEEMPPLCQCWNSLDWFKGLHTKDDNYEVLKNIIILWKKDDKEEQYCCNHFQTVFFPSWRMVKTLTANQNQLELKEQSIFGILSADLRVWR